MDRLYKYYIEQIAGYDMLDTLETFSIIYAKLDIDLDTIGDISEYDSPEEVQSQLKIGIIKSAMDNMIIPSDWDIYEWFYMDDDFICTPPEDTSYIKEEIEKIIDDFNKWTGLDTEIEWK